MASKSAPFKGGIIPKLSALYNQAQIDYFAVLIDGLEAGGAIGPDGITDKQVDALPDFVGIGEFAKTLEARGVEFKL